MTGRSFALMLILLALIGCSHGSVAPSEGPVGEQGGSNNDGSGENSVAPTIYDEFTAASDIWSKQVNGPGSVTFGSPDASALDGLALDITLRGDPALSSWDYVGPGSSNHLATEQLLSFGSFRTRARVASCAHPASEEVITGIFTYSWGGDTNSNGITDNNEIDIETACSMPNILMLTIWTDYDDDSNFQKVTRMVDMVTGEYYQTEDGREGEYGVGHEPLGTISGIAGAGFDITKNFYEIGFDWYPEQVRYFVVIGGSEVTLWDYREKARIPQDPARFIFNVWHTDENWDSGADADYPSADATFNADWFKYWAQQ